ncbi:hypothetical protein CYY_003530 [Polysphondylium violaceum]|uniref:FHA domain-containing protein n=1 Tax=Polysphondylium violaceum TaxID=133409 RepID=A0A8J4V5V1_9MYCE|nr:hypothetical protein CYY_003530 [Polysphondylium violaceum]
MLSIANLINPAMSQSSSISFFDQSTLEILDITVEYESHLLKNDDHQQLQQQQQQQQLQQQKPQQKQKLNNYTSFQCPIWVCPIMKPERNDHLLFFQNGVKNTSFVVDLEEFKYIILGRSTSVCNYVLSHPTVSRKHALIAHDIEGRLQIMDLNSLHGTYVQEKRISPSMPHTLYGGEKIQLGEDTSFFLVSKRFNQNKHTATLLLEKKQNTNSDVDVVNEEILKFFSHINKTDALGDNDIDDIKSTIIQLNPKLTLGKRKQMDNCKAKRSVVINEIVEKFIFSSQDEISNQTTSTKTPINYVLNNNSISNFPISSPTKPKKSNINRSTINLTSNKRQCLFTSSNSIILPYQTNPSSTTSTTTANEI